MSGTYTAGASSGAGKRPTSAAAAPYPRSASAGATTVGGGGNAATAVSATATQTVATAATATPASNPYGAIMADSNGAAKVAGVMQQLAHAKLQYSGNSGNNIYLQDNSQRSRSAGGGKTTGQRPLSAGVTGRR